MSLTRSSLPAFPMFHPNPPRNKTATLLDADSLTFDRISSASGNFSGKIRVVYFSPQHEAADTQCISSTSHQSLRSQPSSIPICKLPLEWGQDPAKWKEVIWNSKRSQRLLRHLNFIWKKSSGWANRTQHKAYHKMQYFNEVIPDHTLAHISGREQKAIQWVFHDNLPKACWRRNASMRGFTPWVRM